MWVKTKIGRYGWIERSGWQQSKKKYWQSIWKKCENPFFTYTAGSLAFIIVLRILLPLLYLKNKIKRSPLSWCGCWLEYGYNYLWLLGLCRSWDRRICRLQSNLWVPGTLIRVEATISEIILDFRATRGFYRQACKRRLLVLCSVLSILCLMTSKKCQIWQRTIAS